MAERTLYQCFREVALKNRNAEALVTYDKSGKRTLTYGALLERVDIFATQLIADGLQAGDKLALMLKNSPEWVIADLATARCGGVVVPIHTTYTKKYVENILSHSGTKYLCVEVDIYERFRELFDTAITRKVYIIGDEISLSLKSKKNSIFSEILLNKIKGGDLSLVYHSRSEDVHTIVYTSGTTGDPKGVELTHRNLLCNVNALLQHIPIYPTDHFLSFLPLSHILERTAGYYVPLLAGASIAYARSIETLADDLQKVHPTVVISVPRIFERVHEKIIKKLSANHLIHWLFIKSHRAAVRKLDNKSSIKDRVIYFIGNVLLFHKIRKIFGGRLRFAISGGAALPKHIAYFFKSLGILVLEGYGLTETSPVLAANQIEQYKFGTVGIPLSSAQISIAQSGEILVKGDAVMKGYHNAPDLTNEVIDKDGWFHTGDIGSIDKDGFLLVTGRIKEMIVLSTGRNVFPVPIEQALEESPLILQAMVYGDSERAISAFIVPEFSNLEAWCKKEGIQYHLPQVLTDQKVTTLYTEEIRTMLEHFQSFEQVRHFKLAGEKFSVENDMLTVSQKLKRGRILEQYKK